MYRRAWGSITTVIGISLFLGSFVLGRRVEAGRRPDYLPVATIKDLMDAIVDPSADDVWNAVQTTVVGGGIEEKVPRTDEEWAVARRGAIRLVEATNLLLMRGRHVARPGEQSETPGVELEPAEMESLIGQDRATWNQRTMALHDASLEALHAADAKDAKKLFEVGDRIDGACESCHRQYWYPNEKVPDFPADFRGTDQTDQRKP